jgi:DNA-binding transcriptional MerR regulator
VYSIAEFSKITGISIKALRLYHEKGLLVPEHVDDQSGYRHYGPASVTRARAVVLLKQMLVPLDVISEILDRYENEADVVEFFSRHQTEIVGRIASLKRVVSSLDAIIDQERRVKAMLDSSEFKVEEKTIDALLIASIRWRGKYSDCGKAFSKLYGAMGRYVCGKPMDLYYDEGYKEDDADIETAVPIRKGRQVPGITIRELPGGKAVSLIHKGPYDLIGRAYEKLADYTQQQQLRCQSPVRQVYIKGPGLIFKNPKNYLTEVIFLVE